MTFDLSELRRSVEAEGTVCRIVVVEARGSTPRPAGTAMLVWEDGQHGTIGGGALEYEAVQEARRMLAAHARPQISRKSLGAALGQCCGGAVTLLWELFDSRTLPDDDNVSEGFLRPVREDAARPPPAGLKDSGTGGIVLRDGWCFEPCAQTTLKVWIWGAGHVGRAVATVTGELPGFAVTLIDTAAARFPHSLPDRVTTVVAATPADLVPHAPRDAHHRIMTYSHAIDLDLCHHLLGRGFGSAGLIGSKTKWARFRKRLAELGHSPAQISGITCPIGDPTLGKHPQEIAVGVATALLKARASASSQQEIAS